MFVFIAGNANAPLTHITAPFFVGSAYPTTQHHLVTDSASATAWFDAVPRSYGRLPNDAFSITNPQGQLSEIIFFQQLQLQQRMNAGGFYRQQDYLPYADAYNYLSYMYALNNQLEASGLNMVREH